MYVFEVQPYQRVDNMSRRKLSSGLLDVTNWNAGKILDQSRGALVDLLVFVGTTASDSRRRFPEPVLASVCLKSLGCIFLHERSRKLSRRWGAN
jgi:hypothetical protein